jgi:hypothetical protein
MTETDLRWRMRQLPRDVEPSRDLWAGIAARIDSPAPRRAPRGVWTSLAVAASVLLALGLGWRLQRVDAPDAGADLTGHLVAREAKVMTLEYRSALRQFDGAPVPASLAGSLDTLDHSAAQIRHAIAADPKSTYLLQQLRKTYSRRLALTQRAVIG